MYDEDEDLSFITRNKEKITDLISTIFNTIKLYEFSLEMTIKVMNSILQMKDKDEEEEFIPS